MSITPTLVWHRQDLRLDDHPALTAAAQRGPIIPIYILDEASIKEGYVGGASLWWLHKALLELAEDYAQNGIKLILKRGETLKILSEIIQATKAKRIVWTQCYEPHERALDLKIKTRLIELGIEVSIHNGSLLHEPELILNQSGEGFKVYTPFSKVCFARSPPPPLPRPKSLVGVKDLLSEALPDWKLRPERPNWALGFAAFWEQDTLKAHDYLHNFIDRSLQDYSTLRNRPDLLGTSRLSPFLHFGQISPRQIWHTVQNKMAQDLNLISSGEVFLREIIWREFAYHTLYRNPNMANKPLNQSFTKFPFLKNHSDLKAWQKGRTGYPIVDAGMRQLWQTGWMHNRVRMIVGSFLVKDLLLSWQEGARWFWDTLVDADLANNSAGWQWIAGCGMDAAPYFRVFNPVLQGKKFDPQGNYIRRYVPELAKLDTDVIHEPWLANDATLQKAQIKLGKDYPTPIIDHAFARRRALAALSTTKSPNTLKRPSTEAMSDLLE